MVRPIMRDVFFLNQKSEPATEADRQVAEDLLDTLKAHEEGCVGMAANMIGVRKNIKQAPMRRRKDAFLWKECENARDTGR